MSTDATTTTTEDDQSDDDFRSYVRSVLADQSVRLEELEEQLEARESRIEELEDRVADLEARTDMLRLVEESDEMSGEQRSAALLQHLQKEARNSKGEDVTSITKERAEGVLHYPDIDRTTYYSDFQRCERLVGDEEVCRYESDGTESRLVLDLEGVENPSQIATEFATE